MSAYAELHCLSNFTFLRGAAHPEELVTRAAALGYEALALTDECSVAGVVRAHTAAKGLDLQLIIGSEFRLADGLRLVLLAQNRRGYGQLCRLITDGRRAAPKGEYRLTRERCAQELEDCLALWIPGAAPATADAGWFTAHFPARAWIAAELLSAGGDHRRLATLHRIGAAAGLPLVAAGDVHMHVRGRRALQDTLTAIRLGTTVDRGGYALYPNGERHLRDRSVLAGLYPAALLQASLDIARRIDFSLDELRYEYPHELVPAGHTPTSWLRILTERGSERRWPDGVPTRVRQTIDHELTLIAELGYEPRQRNVFYELIDNPIESIAPIDKAPPSELPIVR